MPKWFYPTLFDRLVAHVVIDENTSCWNWIGKTRRHAGGDRPAINIYAEGRHRTLNACRVMIEVIHGPMEDGHEASHLCEDNWLCVNPDHLIPETKRENIARRDAKKRARALAHPDYDPDITAGEPATECPF